MRPALHTTQLNWTEVFERQPWRAAAAVLLLAAAVLLSACAGSGDPGASNFGKSGLSGGGASGKIPPPIALIAMNGLPQDKAGILADGLAEEAGSRDIAIVQGNFSDGYQLAGTFEPVQEGGGIRVVYRWTLTGNTGGVLHTIEGQELVPATSGDPWAGVDAVVIRRIASLTAENLATRLAQLGFRVRQAGILPPTHTFARAGPNAEKEYDLETFYGPGSPLATASITPDELYSLTPEELDRRITEAAQKAAAQRLNPSGGSSLAALMGEDEAAGGVADEAVADLPTAKPAPDPKTEVAEKTVAAAAPDGGGQLQIDQVALVGVSGSPGRGNDELYKAMRKVLRLAGWPVTAKAGRTALAITGEVEIGEARGGVQQVSLAWAVKLPDGKVLGTVRQQNDVPAGSLNEGWGQTAGFAAEAAAEGIFALVDQVRGTSAVR